MTSLIHERIKGELKFKRNPEIVKLKLGFIKDNFDFFQRVSKFHSLRKNTECKEMALKIRKLFGYSSRTNDVDILLHFNRLYRNHY